MRRAADDAEGGGPVADLFAAVPNPPRSVPALRLLATLHHLVLSGRAPELARFYPSAGGDQSPDGAWPVALATLGEHADWVRDRLGRTVQTNEPGRATVLFAALLWLTERFVLPVRLLEIGASAGLNLLADRFCYLSGGEALGAAGSPVRFVEPWSPAPRIDLREAAGRLHIAGREGCDPAPLDPRDPEDRITALSYIWPDELERLERARLALDLAAEDPPRVAAMPAESWLAAALAAGREGRLTVVWQSIVRQYIEPEAWQAIERTFEDAAGGGPLVWLRMEPGEDHLTGMELTLIEAPGAAPRRLATCGDHGPPVAWVTAP